MCDLYDGESVGWADKIFVSRQHLCDTAANRGTTTDAPFVRFQLSCSLNSRNPLSRRPQSGLKVYAIYSVKTHFFMGIKETSRESGFLLFKEQLTRTVWSSGELLPQLLFLSAM